MAMGKRTVNSLGVLGVALVLGGAYFGVAAPILSGKNAIELELQQAQQLGSSYEAKLLSFENGDSDATRAATDTMELFDGLVPDSLDIESASRAIAASLPSGVKLESFTFGATQQVSTFTGSPLGLTGFTPPTEFAAGDAAAPAPAAPAAGEQDAVATANGTAAAPTAEVAQGVDPNAPTAGFNRIPFTISVSAGSYAELSAYLNSLSEQPRLMSVVSVDSNRSDAVTATIYAFAYSGQ
jgi:hypothetical protein